MSKEDTVVVDIEFTTDEYADIITAAQEADVTVEAFIEKALKQMIKELE